MIKKSMQKDTPEAQITKQDLSDAYRMQLPLNMRHYKDHYFHAGYSLANNLYDKFSTAIDNY